MLQKRLLLSYYNYVWNRRDYKLISYMFADNFTANYINRANESAVTQTPEDVRRNIKVCTSIFHDLHVSLKNIICDEPLISVHCVYSGSYTDTCSNRTSLKSFSFQLLEIFKIEGGKIREQWSHANVFDVLNEIKNTHSLTAEFSLHISH